MMAAAKGEYKGTGRTVDQGRRRKGDQFGTCLTMAIFFGIFFVLPAIFRRNRFRSHGGGGWWTGGGGFGGFWRRRAEAASAGSRAAGAAAASPAAAASSDGGGASGSW